MFSFWHRTVVGRYAPEARYVGLDFSKLFLDPVLTEATYFHELSHSILSQTTEFGQATEAVFRSVPHMAHLSSNDKESMKGQMMSAQLFVQEGTASLMELLRIKQKQGRRYALDWAAEHLPQDYYDRFQKLQFVFDMGKRYREKFTMVIPHIALSTDIRAVASKHDILRSPEQLRGYLADKDNNPDERFNRLVEVIKYQPYLVTKTEEELCRAAGVRCTGNVGSDKVADFLNYVTQFTPFQQRFRPENIRDAGTPEEQLKAAASQVMVANMNLNFSATGEILTNPADLLHYRDHIKAVYVNRINEELQQLARTVVPSLQGDSASIHAFVSDHEQYALICDFGVAKGLLNTELKDTTLLVKWGLHQPGMSGLHFFGDGMRNPEVVLYNTIQDMRSAFEPWFAAGNRVKAIHIGAAQDHPFQTLILETDNGVVHWVNDFGNRQISLFRIAFKDKMMTVKPDELSLRPQDFNNVMSTWMGLPWQVDWYHTMLDGTRLVVRR